MTDFLDEKVQEIRNRLRELEPLLDEYGRLRAAMDALDAVGTGAAAAEASPVRPSGRRTASAGGSRRGRPRAGGPTRADRLVELANERPGITIAEAAREMDVVPNGLYQVVAKLTAEGLLRKEGAGLFPTGGDATAAEQEQAAEPAGQEQEQQAAEPEDGGEKPETAETAETAHGGEARETAETPETADADAEAEAGSEDKTDGQAPADEAA